MHALFLLLLAACDTTPSFVTTQDIDGAIGRDRWGVVCKGLEMEDDRTREYTTERLVATHPDVAQDCICRNITGKKDWDPAIASGLKGSDSDAFVGCFAELVARPDLDKRKEAVIALGLTAAPVAYSTLATIAQDSTADADIRVRAVQSLAGKPDHQSTLIGLLTSDDKPTVRAAAAGALAGNRKKVVVTALVKSAKEDKEGSVRGAALAAAKASGVPAADKMVCEAMLNDPSAEVRSAAIGAFKGTRRDSATACLRKRAMTFEPDAGVRDRLLEVLKSSPNDKAALILCDAIPFWMRSYVKEDIPDKLPGTMIVKAQNDRDWKRSYDCLQKAWRKSSGYSCFARLHVGVWFRTVGAKSVRVPSCPGYESKK
jgi:hypothetical protein